MNIKTFLCGISAFTMLSCESSSQSVQRQNIVYADPTVVLDGDTYYMTGTGSQVVPGFTVLMSKDLHEWTTGTPDVNRFILAMNGNARELGMTDSKFVSPNGLKDPQAGNSLSSARDMVLLAEQLLEYPPVMQWTTTKVDYVREGDKKTVLTATNHLVNPRWPGVDGMKTGYTSDAGYCLTFTVLRDGRRMVGCVTGFKVGRDRDRFCRKLIDWGYARATQL